jgi:hypothetical protein
MIMNAQNAVREFNSGAITYDELVAQFEEATFAVRQPTEGGWGAVWLRAEEDMHEEDVPHALDSATFARIITRKQRDELMAIYRRKVLAQAAAAQ